MPVLRICDPRHLVVIMFFDARTLRTFARVCLPLLILLPRPGYSIEPSPSVQAVEVLRTTQTWAGKPIELPRGKPEFITVVIEIAPGGETGWHAHPVPSFAFVVAGTLEVKLANGAVKRASAGEAFAEVIDTEHSGRNVGTEPVKLVVFYVAAQGKPTTVRQRE